MLFNGRGWLWQGQTCGENCSIRREICMAAASSMPAPGFCSSVAKAHSVLAISCEVYWCSITAARRAAISSTRCPGLYPSLLYDHRLLQIACIMTRQRISQCGAAGPQPVAGCLRHNEEPSSQPGA